MVLPSPVLEGQQPARAGDPARLPAVANKPSLLLWGEADIAFKEPDRRRWQDEVAARLRQSRHEQELAAGRRRAEERVRIARELHDVVSHTLAVVGVHLNVALDAVDSAPGEARDALRLPGEHNAANALSKRGVAVMPVCFGISFTNAMLNQAGALVHVYTDGSVAVSTGAIEMGQGVSTKLLAIAERTLGIPGERLTLENTNTGRVANTSPTAASSAADSAAGASTLERALAGPAARLADALHLERHRADLALVGTSPALLAPPQPIIGRLLTSRTSRTHLSRRVAVSIKSLSPKAWPRESLTSLKLSRSMNRSA